MPQTDWKTYVNETISPDTPASAARRIGVSRSTIVRWLDGTTPTPHQAVSLAREYGRSPAAALIASGYLTEDDLHVSTFNIQDVPDAEFLEETKRRFNR